MKVEIVKPARVRVSGAVVQQIKPCPQVALPRKTAENLIASGHAKAITDANASTREKET